ncbi:MAG: hypothetical protein HOQ43_13950 [Glycomyces artemisiae]|uniref:Uncharacterized protein n=1 Tax=Glycomyces artemisiae TaxID=1076443 RepID=A0A850CC64_9ACTN|nr:hypothetical protein [Glycomyces artemisiae]
MLGILVTQLAVSVQPATAFAPSNLLGFGDAKTHQSITEEVIEAADKDYFRVSKLSKNMRKARDQIVKANRAVDGDQFSSAKHMDGENFAGGQAIIIDHLTETIAALKKGDPELARWHFGSALHTIQDFYAHSNWVELGNRAPNLDLYYPGRPVGNVAGPTEKTCLGTSLITKKLTSGYYGGEDRKPAIPGKCRHGGPFDKGPGTGGINKDSRALELSPHGMLHFQAAAVATLATRQFLEAVKGVITPKQLRLLLGAGPVIGMSIDTTGSMDDIIAGVKEAAIRLVQDRIGTEEEPIRYVLAPFNDPGAGPALTTEDADRFAEALGSLGAGGGDDCPEMSMTGALQALGQIDDGGSLFVFTDASSKDGELYSALSVLAKRKDVAVYPMIFGSCSPLDPAYIRLARESGGQLFELARADAGTATTIADDLVRSDQVTLLAAEGDAPATGQTYDVPVDSSLRTVTFFTTGTSDTVITRPDGTEVDESDKDVDTIDLSSHSAPAKLVRITKPAAGPWNVRTGGPGPFTFAATGESDLDLSSFGFLARTGRPGHEDLAEIAGLPPVGRAVTADAVVTGDLRDPRFQMRTMDGSPAGNLPMKAVTSTEYTAELTASADPFRVYLTGADAKGNPVQRALRAPTRAQPVLVTPPESVPVRPGQTVTFRFQVENVGAADTFVFAAADDRSSAVTVEPKSLSLPATVAGRARTAAVAQTAARPEATHEVTVSLQVPCRTDSPALQHLMVSAQSRSRAEVFNAALLTNIVGKPEAHCAAGELANSGSRIAVVIAAGLALLVLGWLLIAVTRQRGLRGAGC